MFNDSTMGEVVQPCPVTLAAKTPHWIEIELIGEDNQPIPCEEYLVTLPDRTEVRGYLDEKGFARLENIENPGECQVSFPKLDRDAWEWVS